MEQERTPPATTRARRSSSPPRAQAQAADDAEDRLSALDDGALHAILARLPLRDAAATTVLSRRWPRVFATLPRLLLQPATFNRRGFPDEGDEDYCEDAHRWMDALDRVLNGRAAPVAAFEVCAKFMGLYDDWFDDLFRRICGSGGLLELTVTNTKYGSATRCPPPLAGLRAVRSLRLRDVVATDADLRRLISRCAALEHLEIHDVHRARNVVVRAPCLEKLEVFSFRPLCISVKKAPRQDTSTPSRAPACTGESKCPEPLALMILHRERTNKVFGKRSMRLLRVFVTAYLPSKSGIAVCHRLQRRLLRSVCNTVIVPSAPLVITADIDDTMDSDEDYSFSEIEKMCDYKKMANEIRNMVTFLRGLCGVKKLQLYLPTEYSQVRGLGNGKSCTVTVEFWEEKVDADCALNHLSSVTFYMDSLFKGHPCGGLCGFLVKNARVLRRMRIEYYSPEVRPVDAAKVEAVWCELHGWPRASPDVVLELCPLDRYPCY
uniref:F-box/LRR-repeat protein 15/At3g58940/PEG3-like LRR domain-containing protein n=1 Tax=Setaria viridis TaxID=4556 RepID=A0A4U6WA23_SETVI|nr:hypothetical protein SEVIR_1G069000v2 [Setaria viridis]